MVEGPLVEKEARQGGSTPTEVDPKMLHDGIANEDKAHQEYITYLRGRGCLDWSVAVCGLFVLPNPGLQLAQMILFVMLMTRHMFLDCLK